MKMIGKWERIRVRTPKKGKERGQGKGKRRKKHGLPTFFSAVKYRMKLQPQSFFYFTLLKY